MRDYNSLWGQVYVKWKTICSESQNKTLLFCSDFVGFVSFMFYIPKDLPKHFNWSALGTGLQNIEEGIHVQKDDFKN